MNFALADSADGFSIQAYEPGRIRINERDFTRNLILTPTQLLEDWPAQDISTLLASHFEPLLELRPDILLRGTGANQVFPAAACYADLIAQRIGIEIMDSAAACRTYNILAAEDRRVAAALLLR